MLQIASAFVSARQRAVAIAEFPGPLPPDMASGYAIQEAAIELWPDRIAGWKVGLVAPTEQRALGTTRLIGPIFRRSVAHAVPGSGRVGLAAIAGGFAAIEVELVVVAGTDAQPDKTQWSVEEAAALLADWHLGMEFAASPLAKINDLGAAVTASDFGNNSGLIIGPRLDAALVADPPNVLCRTTIDARQVGLASATAIPGGPLEAVRFLLGHLAARGRPLRAGQWVSTGAITGVHRIFPGQNASVEIVGGARIEVIVAAAAPSDGPRPSTDD